MNAQIMHALTERFVKDGQIVGVGTSQFSEELIRTIALFAAEKGLQIQMVPSSVQAAGLISYLKLPIASLNDNEIDVAFEFMHQVDAQLNCTKLDTLSLIRDKMIGQSAGEMIAIAEEKNFVKRIGGTIPFEISPFAWKRTLVQLENLGVPTLRTTQKGEPLKNETGNYFADVETDEIYSLEDLEHQAKEIPGVLETGLFIGYADRVLLYDGKKVTLKSRIGPEKEPQEAPAAKSA